MHHETTPTIEFCGEPIHIDHQPFTIGRDADLVIDDDNRFLHRQFLVLSEQHGLWLVANVGNQLTATVSDADGRLEAFLAPGAVLPLVFDETVVRFAAGPTTYELMVHLPEPAFVTSDVDHDERGDTTIGRVLMTPDQLRLVLALAEPALLGNGRTGSTLPSSGEAARRLAWTTTKFNRKLDNVCQKLAARGVRGLHGEPGRLASNRRARLVEYALAVRLVTRDDLRLLDTTDSDTDDGTDRDTDAGGADHDTDPHTETGGADHDTDHDTDDDTETGGANHDTDHDTETGGADHDTDHGTEIGGADHDTDAHTDDDTETGGANHDTDHDTDPHTDDDTEAGGADHDTDHDTETGGADRDTENGGADGVTERGAERDTGGPDRDGDPDGR